jgi:hypothetical protein
MRICNRIRGPAHRVLRSPEAIAERARFRRCVEGLRQKIEQALADLDASLPTDSKVKLVTTKKGKGRICVTPLDEHPEPQIPWPLTAALVQRWPMTSRAGFP